MKGTVRDQFAQLASGGKKPNGEVKRLDEIKPKKIHHKKMHKGAPNRITAPTFREQTAYENFLTELQTRKAHYLPFLQNYAEKIERTEQFLTEFDYRKETDADKSDFYGVLQGKGAWEQVSLPHYVGPEGRWTAFYRTKLCLEHKEADKAYLLFFEAVDYIAEVYLNGRLLTRHEGFFAPFTADLTENIQQGENVLLIAVKNDLTTTGTVVNDFKHNGNKIYGATHLGYDEPMLGWHHCPAGAGIYGKVRYVVSPKQRISDIFVRPNIDEKKITVHTTVDNYEIKPVQCKLRYKIEGRNFVGAVVSGFEKEYEPLQNGKNELTEQFTIDPCKLWTTEAPYLYEITIALIDGSGETLHIEQTHFGMRKFTIDENSSPKGAFYFNNERIMLRGTNEMGHLCRCLLTGNTEQLIDDILIAKVANLNFYRMTQRPVLDDIYTYFDMMGMLCQSDFPLFSYLPASALGEAAKQVDEMERLTRNHPCVILETFCNETLDKTAWGRDQYVLSRFQIEKFFHAAKELVKIHNPDRVLKYSEGDYAPLENSYGLNDFHCYTFWYVSHGMPSGKLRKGYLPPIRQEWMTGCGEFGVDGLDTWELMQKYCPKEWLPSTDTEPWSPKTIAKAQCFALHGDFFPEQENAREWIRASRAWQREAIKEYVHIFRLRSDYIQSTTVHLLIDAWPCGWTKTLVDVDRNPKPAYYALKEALLPTRVSLRRDRYAVYAGEKITTEVYAFNDLPENVETKISVAVFLGDELKENYENTIVAEQVATTYCGDVEVEISQDYTGLVRLVAKMTSKGETSYDTVEYRVKPRIPKAKKAPLIYGETLKCIRTLCSDTVDENVVFTDGAYYTERRAEFEEAVLQGKKVVVFMDKPTCVFGENIVFRTHTLEEEVRANNYIATSKESPYTAEFEEMEFMNFYNSKKDYQDLTAWFKFDWENSEEILYTFEDCDDPKYALHKRHKMIMAQRAFGKGKLLLTTLSAVDGCVGCNPVLDKLFINLIEK